MSLEVKVILHAARTGKSTEIGNVRITQVDKHDGSSRTYAVSAERLPMDGGPGVTSMVVVYDHDRNEPVWSLIIKAMEKLR